MLSAAGLVALIPAAALAGGGAGRWPGALLTATLLLVPAAWFAIGLLRGELVFRRSPQDPFLLGLLLLAALGAPRSVAPDLTLAALRTAAGAAAFHVLFVQATSRRRVFVGAVRGILVSGALLSLLGLTVWRPELLGLQTFSTRGHRAALTFANANHFGGFAAATSLLALGAALAASGLRRVVWGIAAVLGLAAVAMSASRGAAVSLAGGIALLAALVALSRPGLRRAAMLIAPLLAGGLVVVALGARAQVARLETLADPLAAGRARIELSEATFRMVLRHPILGTGLGTFSEAFPPFAPESLAATHVNHAHQEYLELAAELGAPGLFLALAGIATLLAVGIRRTLRAGALPAERYLRAGAVAAVVAVLVHATAEFNLHIPAVWLLFLALAAIATAPAADAPEEAGGTPGAGTLVAARLPRGVRMLLAGLLLVGAGLAARAEIDGARAAALVARARSSGAAPAVALRLAGEAVRLAPRSPEVAGELARLLHSGALREPERSAKESGLLAALAAYEAADALRPRTTTFAGARAAILRELGRLEEALAAASAAVDRDPHDAGARLVSGGILLDSRKRSDGAAELRRALELDPSLLPAAFGELRNAGATREEREAVVPDRPAARREHARWLRAAGEPARAAEELARVAALEPTRGNALAHVRALRELPPSLAAAEIAERYAARWSDDSVAGEAIYLLEAAGASDRAAALYRVRIAAEPGDPRWTRGLGELELRRGRFAEAVPLLSRAADLAPADGGLALRLGLAQRGAGDPAAAIVSLRRAVVLAPGDARVRLELARTLRQARLFDLADAELRACAALGADGLPCAAELRRPPAKPR